MAERLYATIDALEADFARMSGTLNTTINMLEAALQQPNNDLMRVAVRAAIDSFRATASGETPAAAASAPSRPSAQASNSCTTKPCKFGSSCKLEGCMSEHVARGTANVRAVLANGVFGWCPEHRRWHADDRGHLCMDGRWQGAPSQDRRRRMREAGYSIQDLKSAQVPVDTLRDGGFHVADLRTSGLFTLDALRFYGAPDLKAGGFTVKDFHEVNYSIKGLCARDPTWGGRVPIFSEGQLRDGGYPEDEIQWFFDWLIRVED